MEEDDGPALALVEVCETQAVEVAIVGLELKPGQALEALVGRAEDLRH